ncbi:MAG: methylmalonyl-CoA mutase family protein [Saprospiraceae bacterium]|nr:methylmalonyl-CoA mutase family protein [Saprospiraceae bacterium]
MQISEPYKPKNKIRTLTATSLFDGHDASINIMRRIIQATGVEVVHLGHNRSANEIVKAAIEENVQSIAITSYQGGHSEFFKYIYELLLKNGGKHIKVFGGGGGTILPEEIAELENYGITKIYSPDDGRKLGLQGMINDLVEKSDFPLGQELTYNIEELKGFNSHVISSFITAIENFPELHNDLISRINELAIPIRIPVIGITGTGGAGKSSIVDEILRRFLIDFPEKRIGIISVDPSRKKSGGALLGDRIRMNFLLSERVFMRSMATRSSNISLSKYIKEASNILKIAGFDLIILESSGIGQADSDIVDYADLSLYVMTPEYGAPSQLEKIDMLDFADVIAINKFDKRGALDALKYVRKQYRRNHNFWEGDDEELPVVGTVASQFNDTGTTNLYKQLLKVIENKTGLAFESEINKLIDNEQNQEIIPPTRVRYLSEISEENRKYNSLVNHQSEIASSLYALSKTLKIVEGKDFSAELKSEFEKLVKELKPEYLQKIDEWEDVKSTFEADEFSYKVRGKVIKVKTFSESLSHSKIPKIATPKYKDWGDILKWRLQENFPGQFPFTSGVYPFKRTEEDPTRMFAGEGTPERTNKRFHYVSRGMQAKRLSTAFDSVTLYGEDPDLRPDIYGKIGNSGVNVCCLDDAKKLYSGFDLCDPKTSVSMTINGPAPTMTAFFMNAAIDQQCEKYIIENGLEYKVEEKLAKLYRVIPRPRYNEDLPAGHNGLGLLLLGVTGDQVLPADIYNELKNKALCSVRGTVQADILKEDQAQNTCIYSIDFSLKMMGDIQQYFIDNSIKNFYSVSISGYHIAEAGANPITQLALTLANGFTYVEYYLARGMDINEFAPNLSYFFSNGMDAEYAVIGRVARRIWSKAMKLKYGANERSQMLKYHIQTSGRSLHAQEIEFNDIRTTLQALYAIYDNCNSLHTNAYDEAITTPTEESVRRALAIQLIINRELGLANNENPNQGSFIIEQLTDLVEEAVLYEFDRISERGGVLGAMETGYQRSKIQEESLYYETLKTNGGLPIAGVNYFLSREGSPVIIPEEVIRSTPEEKQAQIDTLKHLHSDNKELADSLLKDLQHSAIEGKNIFDKLMEVAKYCSLGEITHALFEIGGKYRRSM